MKTTLGLASICIIALILLPSFINWPVVLAANYNVTIVIETLDDNAGCRISIDGVSYRNNDVVSLSAGAHTCQAITPSNWGWLSWFTTTNCQVGSPSSSSTTLTVSGNGVFGADWGPVVTYYSSPGSGGSVIVNYWGANTPFNETYSNGQSGVFKGSSSNLIANPAPGYTFVSWSSSGPMGISSSTSATTSWNPSGPGSLTANFSPIPTPAPTPTPTPTSTPTPTPTPTPTSTSAFTRTLTVVSSHGVSSPSVGSHSYSTGTSISCSTNVSVTENGVIYVCTGWTGTGSVPASGSGFWTPTFSLTQDSSLTWNWQVVSTSGGLLNLPAPSCYSIQNLIDRARLTSVSSGQTVTVSPGQQFSVNYGYQIWQGSNQSEIDQLLFICSWTPTWPPSSAYYNGIYSSIPPSYPGNSGSGTASFTAPSTPGTYYIWLCFGANYGYPQAASTYTTSLSGLPAPIKVVVSSTPTPTSIHTPETSPNNVISTDGGNFASPSPSGMVSFQSINSSQQNMVISYFILGAFGLLSLSAGISAFINRRKSEHFLSLWVLVSGILLLLSGAAIAGSFAKYTLENYGGFLLTMIGVAATLFGIVGDATKRKRYKQILANRFAEISLPSIWACAAGLVFAVDGSVTANQWAKDTIANSLGFGGLLVGICCLILGSFGVIGSVATGWTQKIPDWGKALVRRKVLFLRSSLWVIAFGIILFAVGGLIAMSWAKFTVPNTIGYWVSLIGMGILAIGGAGSLVTPFMFVRKYKRIPIVGVHGAGKSYFLVSLGHLISERGLGGPGDKDTNIFLSKALTYILLGEKIPPTLATSGVEISLKEVEAGSKVIKTNLILTSRDFRGQLYEETMSELMSGAVSEESNKFLEMYRQSDGLIVIIDLVRDVDATQFNGNREFYVRKAFAEQISPLTMGIEIAAEKWHKKKPVFFVFTKSDVHNLSLDELNFYLQRIMASTLARLDQLGVSIRVHSVSSYGWTKRGQTVKLGDLEAAGFKDLLHDIGTCCEQGLL